MIAKVNPTETQDEDALIAELKEQNEFLQRRVTNLLRIVDKRDRELEELKARMRDAAERFDKLLDRIQKLEDRDILSQLSSKRNN
mgnify:CR=1 FL=1